MKRILLLLLLLRSLAFGAQQLIDTTQGAGDSGRIGGAKINANFSELYGRPVIPSSGTGIVWSASGTVTIATVESIFDSLGSTRGSVLYRGAGGWTILAPGTSGTVLTSNGAGADPTYQAVSGGGGGSGTVTSVSLSLPTAVFVSPVSGSGGTTAVSLAPALATQAAHTFFRGPNSGSPATPDFGPIVAGDVPDLSGTYLTLSGNGSALTGLTSPQVAPVVTTLTPGPTVATAAVPWGIFDLTATSDFTLSNPTGAMDGMRCEWRINPAGHTPTLGTQFHPPNGVTPAWDLTHWNDMVGQYHAATSKWEILSFSPGY